MLVRSGYVQHLAIPQLQRKFTAGPTREIRHQGLDHL